MVFTSPQKSFPSPANFSGYFLVLPEFTSNVTSTELLFTLRFTSRQTSLLPRTSANLLHFTTCISVTLTSNFKWRWVLPHIMLDFSPFPPRLKLQSTPGFTSLYLNISSIVSLQKTYNFCFHFPFNFVPVDTDMLVISLQTSHHIEHHWTWNFASHHFVLLLLHYSVTPSLHFI